MSLYYQLSPVHRYCDVCRGFGRVMPDQAICQPCDGRGRVFVDGAPSFGCKLTLADCQPGQEVTLGTGDRGRIIRHCRRGTPTTDVVLWCPMFGDWQEPPMSYPSATGVVIVLSTAWHRHRTKETGRREDLSDPLQRKL